MFAISLFRVVPSVNKILSSYNNVKFGTVFLNTYVDDLKISKKIQLKNQDIETIPVFYRRFFEGVSGLKNMCVTSHHLKAEYRKFIND